MDKTTPTAAELADWVIDGAERTLDLVADVSDADMVGPLLPTINPLLWEIGHLAWFQEKFVLRDACSQPPILTYGDALYDSGAIPHDTRWRLVLPNKAETTEYIRTVARRVADAVLDDSATGVVRHFARYTVHHYDTHTEALTYTRQTLGMSLPAFTGTNAVTPAVDDPVSGDVHLDGGTMMLGADRDDPFAYDNEKWAHPVEVAPFAIARTAVTQAEFVQFVEDGGYRDPRLWSDGGEWLAASRAQHPVYWRATPDGWQRRHFDRWLPLEPDVAVNHINWWEAEAFCRWAGRRLPTEREWEFAAVGNTWPKPHYPWGSEPPQAAHAATDWRTGGPVAVNAHPEGDSPSGCRQMIGNVWEWTASDFTAYPNFERDAYHENSEQFFGHRKVLRGGCWATRGRYLRTGLRNYFTKERRDVITGLRTCAVDQ